MLSQAEENLYTLMHLTGISEEQGAVLLGYKVRVISADSGDLPLLAFDVRRLLERTVAVVGADEACDLELAIGVDPIADRAICLGLSDSAMEIRPRENGRPDSTRTSIAGITRKGCACFAAGFVLSTLIGDSLPSNPGRIFRFQYANLGFPVDEIADPLNLRDSVLAGGGGIGNGFLWALEELRPIGYLAIVDPKKISPGNANRCLYFEPGDNGNKAEILATRVRLPNVVIAPFAGTIHDYVESRPDKRIPTLISTPDSRAVRRSFQKELPLEVFDASTTDVSEIVIHSHVHPTENACLSCVYPHIEDESQRDKHIAENLGLTIEEVQVGRINEVIADKLHKRFPELHRESLVGTAFDSLHKALCGQQKLLTPESKQAVAPFSFVSNLAGVLLALEMHRHQHKHNEWRQSNYMCVSPWHPPHERLRRLRGKNATCEFCSKPASISAMNSVWADVTDT